MTICINGPRFRPHDPRDCEATLHKLVRGFPIVTLTGPRQSGKTTLAKTIFPARLTQGESPGLYFWRDSNGQEVDVIAEQGGRLQPIEIKAGRTVNREFFSGLNRWLALAGEDAIASVLIHGGDESYRHKNIRVVSWRECGTAMPDPRE